MEPGAGERWAERLRTLQLPRIHAYGNGTTWKLLAPLLERKDGEKRMDGVERAARTLSARMI